jgi:hypothetical protein
LKVYDAFRAIYRAIKTRSISTNNHPVTSVLNNQPERPKTARLHLLISGVLETNEVRQGFKGFYLWHGMILSNA